jgi:hypothetical protein
MWITSTSSSTSFSMETISCFTSEFGATKSTTSASCPSKSMVIVFSSLALLSLWEQSCWDQQYFFCLSVNCSSFNPALIDTIWYLCLRLNCTFVFILIFFVMIIGGFSELLFIQYRSNFHVIKNLAQNPTLLYSTLLSFTLLYFTSIQNEIIGHLVKKHETI